MYVTAFQIASRYAGLTEIPGNGDEPHVSAWLADAGLGLGQHDETPWCASFVAHVCRLLALPVPKFPARARSWLTVGTPVDDWTQAWPAFDIVVLKRGDGAQPGPEVLDAPGHVGFFAGFSSRPADGSVVVLAGNQGNTVSYQPFPESRVLGVRRLHDR